MMPRRGTDRPSVALTPDERQTFAEIAARMRYELDGLSFDLPERWWDRTGTALSRIGGRSARRVVRMLTARWTGPVLLVLGSVALSAVAVADASPGARPVLDVGGAAGAAVVAAWVAGVVLLLVGAGLAARAFGPRPERRWRTPWSAWSARRARHRSPDHGVNRSAHHR